MYSGQTYDFGSGPVPYPDAGNGPYTHYIDKTNSNATDTNNTYGTPSKPRLTIPATLSAGSVVEVHGGTYSMTALTSVTGSSSKPVFIRGISHDSEGDTGHSPFIYDNDWTMKNVSYLIVENAKSVTTAFTNGDQTGNFGNATSQIEIFSPCDHIAIRYSEFTNHGDETTVVRAAANLNLGWGDPTWTTGQQTSDIVVYSCWIHDNISGPNLENGIQGMIWNRGLINGWALENNIYNQGEDGIHVLGNPGRGDFYATNIYVGGNTIHDCFENALDVKQCHYMVASGNEFYNFHNFVVPTGGSDGAAIVLNDDGVIADNGPTWIINNLVHDAGVGCRTQKPADIYMVGNVFYDIAHDSSTSRTTSVTEPIGNAIWLSNGLNYHVVNNTVFRCDGGIYLSSATNPNPPAVATIYNNIVFDIRGDPTLTDPNPMTSYHLGLNNSQVVNGIPNWTFDVQNNLLYQQIGQIYNHGTFTNVNGVAADPQVNDLSTLDFTLKSTSPAKDAGRVSDAYDIFFNNSGLAINEDRAHVSRPQNAVWDIGAYEYPTGQPNAPQNLRIAGP